MDETNTRLINYDFLRSISCISIILLHISSVFFGATSSIPNISYSSYILSFFVNGLVRFAVPVFVMLSGAFNLSNKKNQDCEFFYKKILLKVFIPAITFSLVYSVFSIINGQDFIHVCLNYVLGNPYYHMWFVFMIVGLYLLTPFLITVLDTIPLSKNFFWVSLVITVSGYGSEHLFNWDLGLSISYLGYYLLGYYVYKTSNQKNTKKGLIKIGLGFLIELVALYTIFILYQNHLIEKIDISYLSPLSPITFFAAYFIFCGFAIISINRISWFCIISKYSLYIYMWHALVNEVLFFLVRRGIVPTSGVFAITIGTIFVLGVSLLLSICSQELYSYIIKKIKV